MKEIVIDGESLTFDQVCAGAYGQRVSRRSYFPKLQSRTSKGRRGGRHTARSREIAYGITTGFGAFKDKIISLDESESFSETSF